MKRFLCIIGLAWTVMSFAQERQQIWPKGKMPDASPRQSVPYIEWYSAPSKDVANGGCMILVSGGAYNALTDEGLVRQWKETFTQLGFQCVNLVYRTPRPEGLPIYQTAWEDGQRAVRIVRSQAAKRGFDPEKIGAIAMSAGSHLALLLATSSQTAAYDAIDKTDNVPCHINYAILNAPAYVTTDSETGDPSWMQGYGPDVRLSDCFKFDEKTCPISLHHGGMDPYSPNGSTLIYRQLRRMKVPAELHLYPNRGHGAFGLERGVEFLRQLEIMGPLAPEEKLMERFADDDARREVIRQDIWPEGMMPNEQEHQEKPYMEWHFPKELKTTAIQIVYGGGAYDTNNPDSFEATPARRYLNELGITVVTMRYRTPRPVGLQKHVTAWQDLQRCIRLVRSQAAGFGLDPDRIGLMGSSAGGHLTLMGVTSSLHNSYLPIDDIDRISCSVQWGIGIYTAYALTDGAEKHNTTGGNDDSAVLVPEFSFDLKTVPMIFIHGDADGWAAMNSVKTWEKMRAMGIQSELHTLALRKHCFQRDASPGTGSYNWLDRIADFLREHDVL